MTRPNFLLISADQQRGDCLGVEGRAIKTPHLDQLAGQGTRGCHGTAISMCHSSFLLPHDGGSGGGNAGSDGDSTPFMSEVRSTFDIDIEFIGIVKIYNPDDRSLFYPDENVAGGN